MKKVIFFLLMLGASFDTLAVNPDPVDLDTTVRVLFVSDFAVSPAALANRIGAIQRTWNNSGLTSQSSGVTLNFVNNGVPISYPGFLVGTTSEQIDDVAEFVSLVQPGNTDTHREIWGADIVIAFTTEIDASPGQIICGSAGLESDNAWQGTGASFDPLADFEVDAVDRRNRFTSYISVINIEPQICNYTGNTVHEFAHLFGAHHIYNSQGVLAGSHAYSRLEYEFDPISETLTIDFNGTVTVSLAEQWCWLPTSSITYNCNHVEQFSRNDGV